MMVLSGATRRLDTQLDRETVPVGPGLRLCSTYPACKGGRKARGGGASWAGGRHPATAATLDESTLSEAPCASVKDQ